MKVRLPLDPETGAALLALAQERVMSTPLPRDSELPVVPRLPLRRTRPLKVGDRWLIKVHGIQTYFETEEEALKALGGPGSGNHGHAGRPGQVGGSSSYEPTGTFEDGQFVPTLVAYAHPKTGSIDIDRGLVWGGMSRRMDRLNDIQGIQIISTDAGHPELAEGDLSVIGGTNKPGFNFVIKDQAAAERLAQKLQSEDTNTEVSYARYYQAWAINVDSRLENTGHNLDVMRGWWDRTIAKLEEATKHPHTLGGPGSGNFGHAGRPGSVGGSAATNGYATNDEIPNYTGRALDDHISKIQIIPIAQVEATEDGVDESKVERFIHAMEIGDELPAVVVNFSHDGPGDTDIVAIVDGHHRYIAAKRLGYTQIPVRVVVNADDWPKVKKAGGLRIAGGPGSGNHGHVGRPGQVGGSVSASVSGESIKFTTDAGLVEAKIGDGLLKIRESFVKEAERGKGEGKRLYERALRYGQEHDLDVQSSAAVSVSADHVWQSLKDDGWPVERATKVELDAALNKFYAVTEMRVGDQTIDVRNGQPIWRLRSKTRTLGGPGSGNYGHAGRPGTVGGSSRADVNVALEDLEEQYGPDSVPTSAIFNSYDDNHEAVAIYNSEAVDTSRDGVVEKVQLDSLVATQDDVDIPGIQHYVEGTGRSKELPIVLKFGGRYYVVEGHHRAAALILQGHKTTDVEVYTPNPRMLGGPGSGNYGHAGRPGAVGGSLKNEGGYFVPQQGTFLDSVLYFHGTADKNIQSIKENGLIPAGAPGGDDWAAEHWNANFRVGDRVGSVYMALDSKSAQHFATYAVKMHPGSRAVIFAIVVPKDQEARLQIRGDEMDAQAVRLKGRIPPEWIRTVDQQTGELHALEGSPIIIYAVILVKEDERGTNKALSAVIDEIFLISGRMAGGPGSGNFGHSGRPGQVGGSVSARYVGKIEGWGDDAPDLYNIEGGENHGSTVTADTLTSMGIAIPAKADEWSETEPPRGEAGSDERMRHIAWEHGKAWRDKQAKLDRIRAMNPADVNWSRDWEADSKVKSVAQALDEIEYFKDRESKAQLRTGGGEGSGNFGHAGRPGQVGGSAPEANPRANAQPSPDQSWRDDPLAHVPERLYRGTEASDFDSSARQFTRGGELGGGIYFTPSYNVARTYGGGPDASFEAGTRVVHEVEWVRTPAPHEVAYMQDVGDKKDGVSRLVDGNGVEIWRGNWPGQGWDREHSDARDDMFKTIQQLGIKVTIGLQQSYGVNQVSVLDKSLIRLKHTLGVPYKEVPHYEEGYKSGGETTHYYDEYRVKSTARDQPRSPSSRFAGGPGSGNFGHSGRPGQVGGSSDSPTGQLNLEMADEIADVAQKVYDDWDENEDEYFGGGICHLIADEIVGHLSYHGIEASTVSATQGEQHVWAVAKLQDGVWIIDIPPGVYETGSGYTWKKIPGVKFDRSDIVFDKIDSDPSKYSQYTEDGDLEALGGPGSGNFGHAGRPGQVGGSSTSSFASFSVDPSVSQGSKSKIEKAITFIESPHLPKVHLFVAPTGKGNTYNPHGYTLRNRRVENGKPVRDDHGNVVYTGNYTVYISSRQRAVDDFVRTIAHELEHVAQWERGEQPHEAGAMAAGNDASRRFRSAGGPGSGNFDHEGRPGQVGGSAPRKTLTEITSDLPNDVVHSNLGPHTIQAFRVGPTGDIGRGVFFGGDAESIQDYKSLHEGHEIKEYTLDVINPIVARSVFQLYPHFFKGKKFQDAVHDFDKASGFKSSIEASRKAEAKITREAKKRGHDAIIYTSPPAPAKTEIALIDPKKIKGLKTLGGPGSGNFGHAGRPGEVGGSSSHADTWASGAGTTDADVADESIRLTAERYHKLGLTESDEYRRNGLVPRDETYGGEYPDGLTVRTKIPNTDSISATFEGSEEYDELPGIRAFRLDDLQLDEYNAQDDRDKASDLADRIAESGEISPLIVVVDANGPWVLEGNHRARALKKLGKKIVPAVVIVDHTQQNMRTAGGPGSGNFGHAGRPGSVGGSAPSSHASVERLRQKYPDVAKRYKEDSGTEIGSVHTHTLDVGHTWEQQISREELKEISDRWGGDISSLMDDVVALHDIGKGEAVRSGDKGLQHGHTERVMRDVLRAEGYDDDDIALAVELTNHDLIGKAVQGYDDPDDVAGAIEAKAKKIGMSVQDFATLQTAFYYADASAYPFIVNRFMTVGDRGRLVMRDQHGIGPTIRLRRPGIYDDRGRWIAPLPSESLERPEGPWTKNSRNLGGPGSGNFGHAGRPGQVGGSADDDDDQEELDAEYRRIGGQIKKLRERRLTADVDERTTINRQIQLLEEQMDGLEQRERDLELARRPKVELDANGFPSADVTRNDDTITEAQARLQDQIREDGELYRGEELDPDIARTLQFYMSGAHSSYNANCGDLDYSHAEDIAQIQQAILEAREFPGEVLTYRGVTGDFDEVAGKLKVGETVEMKGFQSTSFSVEEAARFMSSGGGVTDRRNLADGTLMEILANRGLHISGSEDEFLLPHGTRFVVVGHREVEIEVQERTGTKGQKMRRKIIQLKQIERDDYPDLKSKSKSKSDDEDEEDYDYDDDDY